MTTPTVVDPRSGSKGKPALEYTPRFGAGGPVTVRGIRLLVVLTLVNTTLLGMSVLGPQLFPFLSQQWQQWKASRAQAKAKQAALALQQQCLDHAAPPGKVAYEEDPVEVERLLRETPNSYISRASTRHRDAPPGWVPPARAIVPDYVPRYTDAVFNARISGLDDPVVFLHGRTTSGGVRYVVLVQLSVQTEFDVSREEAAGRVSFHQSKQRMVVAYAWPAGPGGPSGVSGKGRQRSVELLLPDMEPRLVASLPAETPIGTTAAVDYGNILRVYEGQPDPADPSHFTIPYRLDGRDGVIDGWMTDDAIQLRPREGKWSLGASREAWILPSGPGAQPADPSTRPAGNGRQPQSPP